jgi:hypothetical protein
MTTMEEYTVDHGITVEVIKDRGAQVDKPGGWEHHAYEVRLTNAEGRTIDTPWSQGYGIESHPTEMAAEILDSLVRDSWGADQAFPDWAEEFGYTDPRDAWETYHACEELAPKVIEFLGGKDELERVATEIEPL